MAKRFGFHPSIILTTSGSGGDVGVIGHGSGHGGSDPVPCNYQTWSSSAWRVDYDFDGDGQYSVQEYCWWWEDMMDENDAFTMELWYELNSDLEWEGD